MGKTSSKHGMGGSSMHKTAPIQLTIRQIKTLSTLSIFHKNSFGDVHLGGVRGVLVAILGGTGCLMLFYQGPFARQAGGWWCALFLKRSVWWWRWWWWWWMGGHSLLSLPSLLKTKSTSFAVHWRQPLCLLLINDGGSDGIADATGVAMVTTPTVHRSRWVPGLYSGNGGNGGGGYSLQVNDGARPCVTALGDGRRRYVTRTGNIGGAPATSARATHTRRSRSPWLFSRIRLFGYLPHPISFVIVVGFVHSPYQSLPAATAVHFTDNRAIADVWRGVTDSAICRCCDCCSINLVAFPTRRGCVPVITDCVCCGGICHPSLVRDICVAAGRCGTCRGYSYTACSFLWLLTYSWRISDDNPPSLL